VPPIMPEPIRAILLRAMWGLLGMGLGTMSRDP
jgi:hypothetical protein